MGHDRAHTYPRVRLSCFRQSLPYDDLLQSPEKFAGSPTGGCMDVLSEVLKVVKLQGPCSTTENFPRRGVFARQTLAWSRPMWHRLRDT